MKIVTVVGARPQFIKAAAISRTLAGINSGKISWPGRPAIIEIILHTGQHYDDEMSAVFFQELQIPEPHYHLGVGSGSHGAQTGQMLAGIENVLQEEKPQWVLVYGDTNSTLAGALAATKLNIPVAHIEAGLRSYKRVMPEEVNRVLTDHISSVLFCPSQTAVDNLAKEGITEGVHIVGDVMYEAQVFASERAQNCSHILRDLGLRPKEFLLATVHRPENTDEKGQLAGIMTALEELAEAESVVLPLHPRTRNSLQRYGFNDLLSGKCRVKLIAPVGYLDMVALETSARMILTDSGGIQKEAYWLRIPCITMRDETEWVETVQAGWNVLAGTSSDRIIKAAQCFRTPLEYPTLYGDTQAAEMIVRELSKYASCRVRH